VRDASSRRGEYSDPANDHDGPTEGTKGPARDDTARTLDVPLRREPVEPPVGTSSRGDARVDAPEMASPSVPFTPVTGQAPFGNAARLADRGGTLPGTAATPDHSVDALRSAAEEFTSAALRPVVEPSATMQPPAQILPEKANDVEPPPAPVGTHPIDGWLPIDLDDVERNARMLLNRLDLLSGDDSRGAAVVRCAVGIVGIWAAYEFARSRRRARLAAFADLPPDCLNGCLPEDTA